MHDFGAQRFRPGGATHAMPSWTLGWLLVAAIGCVIAAGHVVRAADDPAVATLRDRIAELRRELARHDENYHRRAESTIADADYDRLRQTLADLERRHPAAARGSPGLPSIADDRTGMLPVRRHRATMLSLEKARTMTELNAFHQRIAKRLGREDVAYVVEPKYDGLAVNVTYERGRLVSAVTRGNGTEGDDITENFRELAGVPGALHAEGSPPVPDVIELRGEIFVPWPAFDRANRERDEAGEPRFASPRNLAAGTIRQHDRTLIQARGLEVVFFGVGACEPMAARPETQVGLHEMLRRWGLPVVADVSLGIGGDALLRAVETAGAARVGHAFPTDGVVVKLDSIAEQTRLGASDAAPHWALAYKFAPERAETRLRAITLQVGRTGVLTPVAELEPAVLGGATISRATLHNREEIVRKDIRVDDFVYVERAGEIIPAVVGVNLSRRSASSEPFSFPAVCPECGARVVRALDEAAVRCSSDSCPAQLRRRLEHYASRACLAIDGLGPATIQMLVEGGHVKDVPDLYRLQRADLRSLEKASERSAERLLAAIERSKQAELWRVIHGLGLPQVGATTAKDLARQCGSLGGLLHSGSGAVAALAEPRFRTLITELMDLGVGTESSGVFSGPLQGKLFALTGTLPNLTRSQATAKIEAAGGRVSSSVSRATDYVVVGIDAGAKLQQARELGLALIDEEALLRMIAATGR